MLQNLGVTEYRSMERQRNLKHLLKIMNKLIEIKFSETSVALF